MKRKVIAVLLAGTMAAGLLAGVADLRRIPAHPIPRQMLQQKTEQKHLTMRKQMTQKAK